jgi:hypothetical protein
MPTVAHEPPAMATPLLPSVSYTSASEAPAPIVTLSPANVIAFIPRVSTTSEGGTPVPGAPPAE